MKKSADDILRKSTEHAADADDNRGSQVFLLLENPKKNNNLGPLLRCASAFGITTIVAVGYAQCAVEGSHGAYKHVEIVAFPTIDKAVAFLREDCKCQCFVGLLGAHVGGYSQNGYCVRLQESTNDAQVVSISETELIEEHVVQIPDRRSYPPRHCPFRPGNVCICLSKEKRNALAASLAKHCDFFAHVPHMGCPDEKQASLIDIPSCLSILLHNYSTWAGYDERSFQGHKFQVASFSNRSKCCDNGNDAAKRQRRSEGEKLRSEQADETLNDGALSSMLFGDLDDY